MPYLDRQIQAIQERLREGQELARQQLQRQQAPGVVVSNNNDRRGTGVEATTSIEQQQQDIQERLRNKLFEQQQQRRRGGTRQVLTPEEERLQAERDEQEIAELRAQEEKLILERGDQLARQKAAQQEEERLAVEQTEEADLRKAAEQARLWADQEETVRQQAEQEEMRLRADLQREEDRLRMLEDKVRAQAKEEEMGRLRIADENDTDDVGAAASSTRSLTEMERASYTGQTSIAAFESIVETGSRVLTNFFGEGDNRPAKAAAAGVLFTGSVAAAAASLQTPRDKGQAGPGESTKTDPMEIEEDTSSTIEIPNPNDAVFMERPNASFPIDSGFRDGPKVKMDPQTDRAFEATESRDISGSKPPEQGSISPQELKDASQTPLQDSNGSRTNPAQSMAAGSARSNDLPPFGQAGSAIKLEPKSPRSPFGQSLSSNPTSGSNVEVGQEGDQSVRQEASQSPSDALKPFSSFKASIASGASGPGTSRYGSPSLNSADDMYKKLRVEQDKQEQQLPSEPWRNTGEPSLSQTKKSFSPFGSSSKPVAPAFRGDSMPSSPSSSTAQDGIISDSAGGNGKLSSADQTTNMPFKAAIGGTGTDLSPSTEKISFAFGVAPKPSMPVSSNTGAPDFGSIGGSSSPDNMYAKLKREQDDKRAQAPQQMGTNGDSKDEREASGNGSMAPGSKKSFSPFGKVPTPKASQMNSSLYPPPTTVGAPRGSSSGQDDMYAKLRQPQQKEVATGQSTRSTQIQDSTTESNARNNESVAPYGQVPKPKASFSAYGQVPKPRASGPNDPSFSTARPSYSSEGPTEKEDMYAKLRREQEEMRSQETSQSRSQPKLQAPHKSPNMPADSITGTSGAPPTTKTQSSTGYSKQAHSSVAPSSSQNERKTGNMNERTNNEFQQGVEASRMAEANRRAERKLSRDEEDAAREERARLRKLGEARKRAMSIIGADIGSGTTQDSPNPSTSSTSEVSSIGGAAEPTTGGEGTRHKPPGLSKSELITNDANTQQDSTDQGSIQEDVVLERSPTPKVLSVPPPSLTFLSSRLPSNKTREIDQMENARPEEIGVGTARTTSEENSGQDKENQKSSFPAGHADTADAAKEQKSSQTNPFSFSPVVQEEDTTVRETESSQKRSTGLADTEREQKSALGDPTSSFPVGLAPKVKSPPSSDSLYGTPSSYASSPFGSSEESTIRAPSGQSSSAGAEASSIIPTNDKSDAVSTPFAAGIAARNTQSSSGQFREETGNELSAKVQSSEQSENPLISRAEIVRNRVEEQTRLEGLRRTGAYPSDIGPTTATSDPDETHLRTKTILASDESYVPSARAAEDRTGTILLQEVDGTPMSEYQADESLYTGRSVRVFRESSLTVPVRVSTPGSIVEYTIEKKSYDFSFGITTRVGQGQLKVVKVSTWPSCIEYNLYCLLTL